MKDYILDMVVHLMNNPYEKNDSSCQFEAFIVSSPVNIIRDVYDRVKSEHENRPNTDSEFVFCGLKSAIINEIRVDSRLSRDLIVQFPEMATKNYRIRDFLPVTVIRDTENGAVRYKDPSGSLSPEQISEFSSKFHLFILLDELEKVMPYSQARLIHNEFVRHPGFLNADTIADTYGFEKAWALIAETVGESFAVWIPKALFD
ncbi:hypothetical protein LMH73_018175 [Vibrio splendidus]|nr:hypothetical protein [Vibrio splendidus]MCC4882942.1 hypothetical protein [Vibrio splendidus]